MKRREAAVMIVVLFGPSYGGCFLGGVNPAIVHHSRLLSDFTCPVILVRLAASRQLGICIKYEYL